MLSRYAEIMKYRMPIKQVCRARFLFSFSVNCCVFVASTKKITFLRWFVLFICLSVDEINENIVSEFSRNLRNTKNLVKN